MEKCNGAIELRFDAGAARGSEMNLAYFVAKRSDMLMKLRNPCSRDDAKR
jgi:hypothetical protein